MTNLITVHNSAFSLVVVTCFAIGWFIARIVLRGVGERDRYLERRNGIPAGFLFWIDVAAAFSLFFDVWWLYGSQTSEVEHWDTSNINLLLPKISDEGLSGVNTLRWFRLLRTLRTVALAHDIQRQVVVCRLRPQHRDGGAGITPLHSVSEGGLESSPSNTWRSQSSIASVSSSDSYNSQAHKHKDSNISRIGQRLTSTVTEKMMLVVLILAFTMPIFDGGLSTDALLTNEVMSAFQLIHRMPQDLNVSTATFKEFVTSFVSDHDNIIYIDVCVEGCKNVWAHNTIADWLDRSEQLQAQLVDNTTVMADIYRSFEVIAVETTLCFPGSGSGELNQSGQVWNQTCTSRVIFHVTHLLLLEVFPASQHVHSRLPIS